ncbi:MAG TPA: two-component regulator propeller domain-containing protein, partial [Chitinophagaceae bacterium]|nr:two-component regulator propeller domain-containing protein [Chitinophagaceae bacterium]
MPKRFFIPLLALTLLISTATSAQQSIFKTYTVSDGLVNNSVRRIFQDSKGFLWIATWEGLSKYDGNRFTNFTESNGLSHNLVNDVVELSSGELYVAMNNGAVDLIRNDRIIQQRILSKIVINRFVFGRTGTLLALTDSAGIAEINGGKIKYLNKSDGASCYSVVGVNDSLLAAATDALPIHIYDKQFRIWSVIDTKINGSVSSCVFKDLQNRLWIGTTKGLKIVSLDYVKRKIKLLDPPAPFNNPLLSKGYVSCMFQERNGTIWVGTAEGLINISKEGQLRRFTEHDGLPSRFINYIFRDREDNLWIGTNLGLAKIIAPAANAVPQLFNEQAHVSVIERISSHELLIVSDRFFYRYNFQNGKIENILRLQPDKNFIYVTNSSPVMFLYGNQFYSYDVKSNRLNTPHKISAPVDFAPLSSATTTDQHTIFIPVLNAIAIFTGKCLLDSTFKMRVNNILADQRGYIWLGTWDDGLYRGRYDVQNEKWTEIIHVSRLPDNHIRSLFADR